MSGFDVYDPGEFFEKFVEPTYRDYLAAPLEDYRVKNAAAQFDILAERMWRWWSERDPSKVRNIQSAWAYREMLSREYCPDFEIVWGMHDAHKHVELTRGHRIVSSARQSGKAHIGGAFDEGAFDDGAFDCGIETFVVRLPGGESRDLAEVFANVHAMWDRILGREDAAI